VPISLNFLKGNEMKRSRILSRLFAVGQTLVLAIAMVGLQHGVAAHADSSFTLTAPTQTHTAPVLNWTPVEGSDHYVVYKNARKYRIVNNPSTTFRDNLATEGTYTYYVLTYMSDGTTVSSNTVTVVYDPVPPTITASVDPQPNGYGWNTSDVTVSFTCNDDMTGVAFCSSPVTVTDEVLGDSILGTALDGAGNVTYVQIIVNIDKGAPEESNLQASIVASSDTLQANVSVDATDAQSGVLGSEFYIDTDPGVGNGTPMYYNPDDGTVSTQADVTGLSAGTHTVYVRTQDVAGNWSDPISTDVVVE
jgi:hypothetical protein